MSGAQIVVLHVPSLEPPQEAGSLPAPRLADHVYFDWLKWRGESLQRFTRAVERVPLRLEVALELPRETILTQARRLRADLMVVTWKGEARAGRAETLKAVAAGASCPVIIIREQTEPARNRHRGRAAATR